MRTENEMMEFLERFGKLSVLDVDDIDVYSLSNKNGSIITYINFECLTFDKVLGIMIILLKDNMWDKCCMEEKLYK